MKQKLYILFIFLFAFNLNVKSNGYVDSLKTVLLQTTDLQSQFDICFLISKKTVARDQNVSKEYYSKAAEISKKINTPESVAKLKLLDAIILMDDSDGNGANVALCEAIVLLKKANLKVELMNAYTYLGMNRMALGEYLEAIDEYKSSIEIAKELNDQTEVAENNMYMGRCFQGMGNIPKSLEHYQIALGIAEPLKKEHMVTQINLFIGSLYTEGVNDKIGMEYLQKAAKVAERMKDTSLIVNAYVYIANQLYYQKEYALALKMYKKIIDVSDKFVSRNTYAGTLGNMGSVYSDMGQFEKAMELQEQALKIFEEIGDKQGSTICYSGMGINYIKLKQYDKALACFDKSLPMAEEMQSLEDLIEIHGSLSKIYEETKDFEKAHFHYKLYAKYNDSVFNTNNSQKIAEMELNYRFEAKQKEAQLLQELTHERFKRTVIAAVSGGLILILIVILVLRSNRQRKIVNQQLTFSHNAIRQQKEELETHKKEITDSINYAKRIQESILPPDNYWKSCLPDSFIFYRPKDIVSGDFYWIEQKGDTVCFAAVDCTGHGVPGALMSVVGFNLLTQAVNEMSLTIPSEILKHLDHGVTKTLRQSEDGKGVKDGMDLSLCSLNLKTNELQYAGAYNSLYYVDGGVFKEVKSDKFPIGVNIDGKVDNYTNHSIQLKKGDCVYLFSDGYADQFGGSRGKKFKYNQLKELLHKNYLLPIEEQKEQLAQAFDSWKGELEQVDDVVIIGVRV